MPATGSVAANARKLSSAGGVLGAEGQRDGGSLGGRATLSSWGGHSPAQPPSFLPRPLSWPVSALGKLLLLSGRGSPEAAPRSGEGAPASLAPGAQRAVSGILTAPGSGCRHDLRMPPPATSDSPTPNPPAGSAHGATPTPPHPHHGPLGALGTVCVTQPVSTAHSDTPQPRHLPGGRSRGAVSSAT